MTPLSAPVSTISVLILLLSLSLSGCGSLMSSAGAEPMQHDPGQRSLGAQMDDETIETRAMVNIDAADTALRAAHINVISYNGYVLIVGQVLEQSQKDKVSAIVTDIRDVRRIYNELEIAGNNSMLNRSSDTWITAKIKSNLLASSETEGNRVKVVTENGVVYLMGLATHAEADRIEIAASASQGVQKVVRIFEYID